MHITFFGSDLFSITSLKHLQKLSKSLPIDLLCVTRPPQKSGRGRKMLVPTPIHKYALGERNGDIDGSETPIPVKTVSSLMDFRVLPPTDVAVAVSFGVLIPELYLKAHAKYGGLNVHPSLLPQLAGAAPLHRALLQGLTTTGVSIQTLHPTKFDKGRILMQQEVPVTEDLLTLPNLSSRLAEVGGELLAETIRRQLYIPENYPDLHNEYPPSYAKKIVPDERHLDWQHETQQSIITKFSVFGTLFTFKDSVNKKTNEHSLKRILFSNVSRYHLPVPQNTLPAGSFQLLNDVLVIKTADDKYIQIGSLKIDGIGKVNATKFISSMNRNFGNTDCQFVINKDLIK